MPEVVSSRTKSFGDASSTELLDMLLGGSPYDRVFFTKAPRSEGPSFNARKTDTRRRWKDMIDRGSCELTFTGTLDSAQEIIDEIVARRLEKLAPVAESAAEVQTSSDGTPQPQESQTVFRLPSGIVDSNTIKNIIRISAHELTNDDTVVSVSYIHSSF